MATAGQRGGVGVGLGPASIGNLICGFDVLGLALSAPVDRATARRVPRPGIHLAAVAGATAGLPEDPEANVAVRAVRALLADRELAAGVELTLHKGVPVARGLGSSAASAVAALRAVDEALALGASRAELLRAAAAAESGGHLDNVAAALAGGLVLVHHVEPPVIVPLPLPPGLTVAVCVAGDHLETERARAVLPGMVSLATAVRQGSHLGALVAGLASGDWGLVRTALSDHLVEPARAPLVGGFAAVKQAALAAGALGAGIAGAGPSLVALCAPGVDPLAVGKAMMGAHEWSGGRRGELLIARPAPFHEEAAHAVS